MKDFFSDDNHKSDVVVGGLAAICLVLAVLPFMPGDLAMVLIGVFIALYSLFAVLIWRERPRDEREVQLITASDRWGFLAGASGLSVVLVIQTLRHEETVFYIVLLVVMILAKLISKHLQK